MPECQSEVPVHARRAGAVGSEAAFEVKLHRASDELWGFAWSYGGLSARRLIISGVNARSPAGRFANLHSGDELLSVNGAKGLEDMRRELYEALDVTLLFRSAAQSPPPPPTRRSTAPASGSRKSASVASRRQAPIAPPSIKARVKNSFIHFSDSEEAGESSDDGLFSTSDPLPISRLGKPLNFRSPYMSGCLAGLDLPRVAAVCDSQPRSDEDWASARSLSSEDGSASGDRSNQSIRSCPSTDWDFPSYPPVAAPMPAAQYFHPLATALPNTQSLNPMGIGRLMMWPCPVGGVGCGSSAINASYAAEVPAPVPPSSPDSDDSPAENPAVATTSGNQDEVSDNMDGSRPLTHTDPSDKSEGGSSEAGPLPKTMAKLWEAEGFLKPDDPQSSMDESTTYASTILGPQKKVRRGGKRMHRPCHQRAKQESEGQKGASLSQAAFDASVNPLNSTALEGRSFYPASRKKLQHADAAGETDSKLSSTAAGGEETLPPEGERVSAVAAPTREACLPETVVVSCLARDEMQLDAPLQNTDTGSDLAVPEIQASPVAKLKASALTPVVANSLLNAPPPEAEVDTHTRAALDLQLSPKQYFEASPSRSQGRLTAKGQLDAEALEADVAVSDSAVIEVQPLPEPKRAASAALGAVPKAQSVRVQKRKVSRRRSSGGSAKGHPDMPPLEPDADASNDKDPDVQPTILQKRKASPTKSSGRLSAKGLSDATSPKPGSERVASPVPKRKVQSSRTSAGQAVHGLSGTPPSEADVDASKNALPGVRPSPEPKRKSSLVRSSKLVQKAAEDELPPGADADVTKGAYADAQASRVQKRKPSARRSISKPAAKAQVQELPPEAKAKPSPQSKVLSTSASAKVLRTKESASRDVKAAMADAADGSQNGCEDDAAADGNPVTNRWQRHRASMSSTSGAQACSASGEKPGTDEIKNNSQAGTAPRGSGVSAPKWRPSLRLR